MHEYTRVPAFRQGRKTNIEQPVTPQESKKIPSYVLSFFRGQPSTKALITVPMAWARQRTLNNKDAPTAAFEGVEVGRKIEVGEKLWGWIQAIKIVPLVTYFPNAKPMCLHRSKVIILVW